jgi:hypothetical protein
LEVFYGVVKRIVKSFERMEIDYAFTGALAVSFYGVPRTTVDVDVVVAVAEVKQRVRLVEALKRAGLVVGEREIDRALKSGYKIATFRDSKTAYSVDVIFSDGKLVKRAGTVAGLPCFYQTPEQLILAKLRMIKATKPRERALKDEEDIKAILNFTKVNVEAVKRQAEKDNTSALFDALAR